MFHSANFGVIIPLDFFPKTLARPPIHPCLLIWCERHKRTFTFLPLDSLHQFAEVKCQSKERVHYLLRREKILSEDRTLNARDREQKKLGSLGLRNQRPKSPEETGPFQVEFTSIACLDLHVIWTKKWTFNTFCI